MPLHKGFSAATFEKNVRKLVKEGGRSTRQIIAIAYAEARRALKAARKRESQKLRDGWKVAIGKGLKGSSKRSKPKPKNRSTTAPFKRHYDVRFKVLGSGKTRHMNVRADNLTHALNIAKVKLRKFKSGVGNLHVRYVNLND